MGPSRGGPGWGLGLIEVVVMVVMFVVVVVLMSLDGLPSRALVHHHGRQLPPHGGSASCGQWGLQAPAACLALLGSMLLLPVPQGCQGGEEGWAGGQVGRGGHSVGGGHQWGLASRTSGSVAHTHVLALGLGGPHKVLAPILGTPEPLLELRCLGEWGVKEVEGARVHTLGPPVRDVGGFWLVGARASWVGDSRGQL